MEHLSEDQEQLNPSKEHVRRSEARKEALNQLIAQYHSLEKEWDILVEEATSIQDSANPDSERIEEIRRRLSDISTDLRRISNAVFETLRDE